MRPHALTGLTAAMVLLLGVVAHAQQPAQPAASPPPPENGVPINNEQAREVAGAAVAEARKNGWRLAVAVVDLGGHLVYFEKLDGTQFASGVLAQAKARTSVFYRRPTRVFSEQFAAGNVGFMSFPEEARPIASEGGLPILLNGRLIGGIGVSGGSGREDGVAATAGANAIK